MKTLLLPDNIKIQDAIASMIRKHNLEVESLTENQLVEAIRQALPDFQRNVHVNGQSVTYLPGADAHRWRELCYEARKQRDAAIEALRSIEERYSDGEDTHGDWRFMGETARKFLSTETP